MKKRFRSFTAVLLAVFMVTTTFSAMPLTVSASEATEDSVGATSGTTGKCTWTLDDNGVFTISGNGTMENYSNPSNVPWRNLEFTKVVIEDGVTNIGKNAFCNCDKLTAVTISNSVTIIENSAFNMCPYFVIYGNRGFYAETYAKSHGIPFVPVNQDIAKGKAGKCTWYIEENGILTISVKENVTEQPDTTTPEDKDNGVGALNNDEMLGIQTPEDDEEYSLHGQPPIPLPNDDEEYSSTNETSVIPTSEDDEESSNNDETFDIPDYPDNSAPWGAYEFSEVIIEDGVTSIGDYAFSNRSDLNHIMIPDSVTSIGDNAFSNCPNLTIYGKDNSYAKAYANSNNIEFVTVEGCGRTGDCLWLAKPGGFSYGELIIYGNGAMSEYSPTYSWHTTAPWTNINLRKLTIEDGVTRIGSYAFHGTERIYFVSIPKSVTSIGSYAFSACHWLFSITLPNSITSIGSHAFDFCDRLKSINLPNSVTSIGSCAFERCESLKSITLPNNISSIEGGMFSRCSNLTSINIPDNVTSIGSYAFSECTNLKSITIPSGVTSIDYGTFYKCTNLTTVTIPNSVISIGKDAFVNCKSLSDIIISDSVTFIGGEAFYGCESLTSITIPNRVTEIGVGAFGRCKNLSSLTVSEGNENYDSRNNCNAIIETASNTLIQGCNNTVIPDGVTSIFDYAFNGFTYITSVTIPESVTIICDYAFSGCGLTSVTIPESVTRIGKSAFNSSGLTSVTIPNSVTSIGWYAFKNCKDLVNITLPDSITEIRCEMFYNCSSLTKVIIPDNVTYIGSREFGYYDDHGAKKIEDFVIIGHKNSEAQRYADENGFEFIPFELGEINSDGVIDIRDVTAIQKGLAGLSELSDIQLVAADVNADKAVDVNDATHMQKYLAFLIDELG
ncbi:MAG: leucine-rich repeat protein [Ruminococcus sp.]|nr:leucine-rich repeat protein [Ruminococcus sp.]